MAQLDCDWNINQSSVAKPIIRLDLKGSRLNCSVLICEGICCV